MKLFRTVLFWCHLAAGSVAGIVILMMCVTGVLLTFERQMIGWAESYPVSRSDGATARLPLSQIVAAARMSSGAARVQSVAIQSNPDKPVGLTLQGGRMLFVDPYTGAVVGEGSKMRTRLRYIQNWHRWFAAEALRPQARMITGVSNLLFLFIVCSGIYLWWPKRWTWRVVKQSLLFDGSLRGKPRDWNWHNVMGIWTAPVLFFVVLTGVFISYQWPRRLVNSLAGEPLPAEAPGPRGDGAEINPAPLEPFIAQAQQTMTGWLVTTVQLPVEGRPAAITVAKGNGRRPTDRLQFQIDTRSWAMRAQPAYAELSPARKALAWNRSVHTGEAAGVIGQIIAGIASAAGALLVYTGIALMLRRFRAWVGRRRREATGALRPARSRVPDDADVAA